jgi:homoserine kinase
MQSKYRSVLAKAPATVANVSCGFDVLGFALFEPADEVRIARTSQPGIRMEAITGDDGRLPLDAGKNTCSVAVDCFLKAIGASESLAITLQKKLPLGSGMGSSAASAVAALMAVNHMFGNPLTRAALLPFAMEAERIACGSAHADNVAPALLGGFTLIRSYKPLDVVSIPTPPGLFCLLVHPHIEVKTSDARSVLRNVIPLEAAITQSGNIAGLIAGLMKPDLELVSRSLHDVIAEPVRSLLIPGFEDVKKAVIEAGALGCGISGSGPTLFALCEDERTAWRASEEAAKAFNRHGLSSDVFVSQINPNGGEVIEVNEL